MKYKINAFLIYDAIAGSLKLDDDAHSNTQLTITANALLFFLIKNPGVMSRDTVMQRVWDDNGLVSSNSNLNQYLSMLRKAFRCYGIENVIVTVSRGRLEINPELMMEVIDDTLLHPLLHVSESEPLPTAPPELLLAAANFHDRCLGYAGAAISLLAIALFNVSWAKSDSLKPITLTLLAPTPVEVFTTDIVINSRMRENYLNNFIAVKERKKIKYNNKEEKFLFFYGDKLQSNGLGRTFLAHCAKRQNNTFGYCDNYFYYSWK